MNFLLGEPADPALLPARFSSDSDGDGEDGVNASVWLSDRCRQRPRSVVEPVEGFAAGGVVPELRRRLRPRWDSSSVGGSRWWGCVERIGEVRIAAMVGSSGRGGYEFDLLYVIAVL